MFVHVHTKSFSATVTGTRLRDVACEKCATPFAYHLDRTGKGTATSVYGIGDASLPQRAQAAAQKQLDKRLTRDAELVPCPKCQWVNLAALRIYRKTRYQLLGLFAASAVLLALAGDLIIYIFYRDLFNRPRTLQAVELWGITGIAVIAAAFCLILQAALRQRINPNRSSPAHLPPGTPPALLITHDAAGNETLTPVSLEDPELADAQWALFRPGRLLFEPLCCQCLDAATNTFTLPATKTLPAPLCLPCAKSLRSHFWRRLLLASLLALLLGWLIMLPFKFAQRLNGGEQIMCSIASSLFLEILAVTFTYATAKPYRLKNLDPRRGIQKISFKNPAYTAILIRRLAQADGLV